MEENNYLRSKFQKSFIKVGHQYVDIKECVSFYFVKDPTGYVEVNFIFLSNIDPLKVKIKNKNELSFFFLELENFFDDPMLIGNLKALMKEIDEED